jgi:hypothetical protein
MAWMSAISAPRIPKDLKAKDLKAKDLRAKRFVSKKDRLEKVDGKTSCRDRERQIRYHDTVINPSRPANPAIPSFVRHFPEVNLPHQRLRARFRHVLSYLLVSPRKKYSKTTLG